MNRWLMKSEPDEFSIDDLKRRRCEPWTGVRNYQARNHMRDGMGVNDAVFFYHSSCAEPGIVGLATVASQSRPDPTQFDAGSDYFDPSSTPDNPRWFLVDIAFKRKLRRIITLEELKTHPQLSDFTLVRRGNRLSVLPVTRLQWEFILALE